MSRSIESNSVKTSKALLQQQQDQHLASLSSNTIGGTLSQSQQNQHNSRSLECPQNQISSNLHSQHSLQQHQQMSPSSVNNVANDLMTQQILRAAAAGCFATPNGLTSSSCPNSMAQNQSNFNPMANLMAAVSTATASAGTDHSVLDQTSGCTGVGSTALSNQHLSGHAGGASDSCSPPWDRGMRVVQHQQQNGLLRSPPGGSSVSSCPANPRQVTWMFNTIFSCYAIGFFVIFSSRHFVFNTSCKFALRDFKQLFSNRNQYF